MQVVAFYFHYMNQYLFWKLNLASFYYYLSKAGAMHFHGELWQFCNDEMVI